MSYVEQNGIRTFDDGREVCATQEAWGARRREVWLRDGRRCQCAGDCHHHKNRKCNALTSLTLAMAAETSVPVAHIHHGKRRGLGGSTRDDRLDNLFTNCGLCHANEHVKV